MGGREFTRFESYWCREWWHSDTAKLIQSWGDAIAVVLLEVLNCEVGDRSVEERTGRIESAIAELERLRTVTTPAALRGTCSELPLDGDWSWFLHDVYSCSGAGLIAPVEQLGIFVNESFGRPDLAQRLIEIDAFLEPEDAGAGAAHLAAVSGRRVEGIRALVAIVDDEERSGSARVHALACLKAVRARDAGDAASRLLDATRSMDRRDAEHVAFEVRQIMGAGFERRTTTALARPTRRRRSR